MSELEKHGWPIKNVLEKHQNVLIGANKVKQSLNFYLNNSVKYKHYFLFSYQKSLVISSKQNNALKEKKTIQNPINFFKTFKKPNEIGNYKDTLNNYTRNHLPFDLFKENSNENQENSLEFGLTSKFVCQELLNLVWVYLIEYFNIKNQKVKNFNIFSIYLYKIIKKINSKKTTKRDNQLVILYHLFRKMIKNSKNLPYSIIILYINVYMRFFSLTMNSKKKNKNYTTALWRVAKKRQNQNSRSWIYKKYWLKVDYFFKLTKELNSVKKKTKQTRNQFFYKNLLTKKSVIRLKTLPYTQNFKKKQLSLIKVIKTRTKNEVNVVLYSCFLS